MELYIKLIDVILPVFFVIGIGYYLGKKDPNFNTDFITTLAGNVGTPAMIFYTITSTGVTLETFIEYFIYALIIIGGFSVIGVIVLALMKKDVVSELPPLILPNTGNMGIPICLWYRRFRYSFSNCISNYFASLHFRGPFSKKKFFT